MIKTHRKIVLSLETKAPSDDSSSIFSISFAILLSNFSLKRLSEFKSIFPSL